MKKKGFTLVELLGVIVILAIIVLLAVSGYGKITENIKQKSYENLVQYIETKAASYAEETGNLITNVDTLMKNGYIEADNEEGDVLDPRNGDRLNCHIVSIIREENLYGQYSEAEECNLENLKITNLNLEITKYKTEDTEYRSNPNLKEEDVINDSNAWVNKNVYLVATLGEKLKGQEEKIRKIIWTDSNIKPGTSETRTVSGNFTSQNKYLVQVVQGGIVDTNYEVEIELEGGTRYQTQVAVKIDKQRPIIQNIEIEKENEWTSEDKKITITATDRNGSGIYGYSISKYSPETGSSCLNVEYVVNESTVYEATKEAGVYYVCVMDKAGNVSEDNSTKIIEVKNIDKEPPKLEVKANPLLLNDKYYEFKDNVAVEWGPSGEGQINCNPTISKKTGEYEVTCIAIGNNGLASEEGKFAVRHSYPATKVSKTCTKKEKQRVTCKNPTNCSTASDGSTSCDYACSDGQTRRNAKSRKCDDAVICPDGWTGWGEEHTEVMDVTIKYDCSYYTCPNGGSLKSPDTDHKCYY